MKRTVRVMLPVWAIMLVACGGGDVVDRGTRVTTEPTSETSFPSASPSATSSPLLSPPPSPSSQPETVEYKLAVVDSGRYVAPDDPVVREFALALDALEPRCPDNTREEIGDYTVSIQRQLAEEGVSESLLEILQSAAGPAIFLLLRDILQDLPLGAIPSASREGDCAAYLTAYHQLRIGRA